MIQSYNFETVGLFSDAIGASLFPPNISEIDHNMMVYGVYATGFIARPLGGALFGYIADVYGRKRSFQITLTLMVCALLEII